MNDWKPEDLVAVIRNDEGEAIYRIGIVEPNWIHFRNAAVDGEPLSRMARKDFDSIFRKIEK